MMIVRRSSHTHTDKQLIKRTRYVNHKGPRGLNVNMCVIASSLVFVRLCGRFINRCERNKSVGGGKKYYNNNNGSVMLEDHSLAFEDVRM